MLFTPKSSESLYTEVTESYKVDILIFTWQIRLQRPKKESFSQCMNKDLSNIPMSWASLHVGDTGITRTVVGTVPM